MCNRRGHAVSWASWTVPFFFSYTVLLPARDAILFFSPIGATYIRVSIGGAKASRCLLALAVIFETTCISSGHIHSLRLFPESAVDLGGRCGRRRPGHCFGPRGQTEGRAFEWIILLERSARFLQVCLLIVAIALMSRLGLTWHNYSVGIAAGFGVYAALDLALLELRAHLHVLSDAAFVLLRSAAYNLGVAIWAFYFLRPQGGKPVGGLPGTDLANWNNALTEHVNKWYRH